MKKWISNLLSGPNGVFGKPSTEAGHSLTVGKLAADIVCSSYRGSPCLVIDSNGEQTLDDIWRTSDDHHTNLTDRLRVFSFGNPLSSYHYNPLKHGNADQIFRKVQCALDLDINERQVFGVTEALRTVVNAVVHLKMQISFGDIAKIFRDPQALEDIDRDLTASFEAGVAGALACQRSLRSASSSFFYEPVFAKLATDLDDFDRVLNASMNLAAPGLDVTAVIPERQIVFFQLNLASTGSVGRRLGRMIVEDLNISMTNKLKMLPHDRGNCSVFIGEAIDFGGPALLDILRTSRASGLAVRLYARDGLELDLAYNGFVRGILNNTLKIPAQKIGAAQEVAIPTGPEIPVLIISEREAEAPGFLTEEHRRKYFSGLSQ